MCCSVDGEVEASQGLERKSNLKPEDRNIDLPVCGPAESQRDKEQEAVGVCLVSRFRIVMAVLNSTFQ